MTSATVSAPPQSARQERAMDRGLTPKMLNHVAYVTHDVAATADFYIRILGMEIASTIVDDAVPSTGDPFPYLHIFFRMADGSTIAFFEVPGLPQPAASTHPAYDVFNHIALQVDGPAEIERWRQWLTQNGVEFIGPVDHKGMILSIYFHDPSGNRLELTTPLDRDWNRHAEQGYRDLENWVAVKERARREGRDETAALVDWIREQRKRYTAQPA
jgi:catechol 2,3-dioxygenase-like lactoylglutathione lyase family enzyme